MMKNSQWMHALAVVVLGLSVASDAFSPDVRTPIPSSSHRPTPTALWAKKRKAQRRQKVEKTRPKSFVEKMNDVQDDQQTGTAVAEKPISEAQERMNARPEVSTMVVDEETGIEVVYQGRQVMDVVTRQAVQLSPLGAEYRLAQQFPGVPPDVRQKYRFDPATSVPERVELFRAAAALGSDEFPPPHPSVTNSGLDFVTANHDLLGANFKRTLLRLQMHAASIDDHDDDKVQQVKKYGALVKNFCLIENYISGPFRQMIHDAEGRMGPNFGNLDVASYAGKEVYERVADYLVIKGMVAHWEKKVIDADYTENTRQTKENYMTVLSRGDPRRFLPDPPILFTMKECTQVCCMSQQITKAFCENEQLFADLPPEVRFVEDALSAKGNTPLRQFAAEEFCPKEGITTAALREGLRRLVVQMENLQVDPYGDLTNIVEKMVWALSLGSEDEKIDDAYLPYLANKDPNGPGGFQTYTFNHEPLSMVRFLDGQYPSAGGSNVAKPSAGSGGGMFSGLFNLGSAPKTEAKPVVRPTETYKVPEERAAGRPHELGWLELLKDEAPDDSMKFGNVPPGKIL